MSRKSNSLFQNCRTRHSIGMFLSLCVAALMSTACMTSKREEEIRALLETYENRIITMEKQLQLRDRTVDAVKDSSDESTRKFLSAKSDLDEVKRQMAMTQGAIDELRVKFARVQGGETGSGLDAKPLNDDTHGAKLSELDEWKQRIEKRVTKAELLAKIAQDANPKPQNKLKVKSSAELAKILSAAYAKKEYSKVVKLASSIIHSSKNESMKTLAMEFRAEAQFQLQNYDLAAVDLFEIIDKYPSFERKPRALLLAGDSCVYLKELQAAKALYMECVQQFPDREECKASKERLARLGV
jgi:TolA-binding protein